MNKICKEYISEIKKLFPIKGKSEKIYIKKLVADIQDYCEEQPTATKADLYKNYGKPQEIVHSYLSSNDTAYIIKRIKLAKHIKICTVTTIILALVASLAFCTFLLHTFDNFHQTFDGAYYETTIVEFN